MRSLSARTNSNSKSRAPRAAFAVHYHAESETQTSREMRDLANAESVTLSPRFLRRVASTPPIQGLHPQNTRHAQVFQRFCLRRSTLTGRGTPLASLKVWRVASPTPRLNTKAGFINSMSYTNDQQPQSPSDGLFGEVISTYTDREAVSDGVLVALAGPGGVNRVTRAVFDHFAEVMGPGVTNITPLIQAMEHMLSVEVDGGWRTTNYRGKALWLSPTKSGA